MIDLNELIESRKRGGTKGGAKTKLRGHDYYSRIGKLGMKRRWKERDKIKKKGIKLTEIKDISKFLSKCGKKGGKIGGATTKKRYGSEHYRKLGKHTQEIKKAKKIALGLPIKEWIRRKGRDYGRLPFVMQSVDRDLTEKEINKVIISRRKGRDFTTIKKQIQLNASIKSIEDYNKSFVPVFEMPEVKNKYIRSKYKRTWNKK